MSQTKTCVIYHYYEAEESYKDNFLHFITFGYVAGVDYFIVISGSHSLELPILNGVQYIHTENKNHDFGGYSFALTTAIETDSYDYFIFVNSTVRGPYLPQYVHSNWISLFTEKLSSDVGLVGTTINILNQKSIHSIEFGQRHGGEGPFSHVQTMVFALSKESLAHAQDKLFKPINETLGKFQLIADYEIFLSQCLIRAGWNIKCLLPEYNTIDYRQPHSDVNPTSLSGDPCYEGAYFGRTLHPYDVVFIKTNRNVCPPHYLDKMTYALIQNRKSEFSSLSNHLLQTFIEKKLGEADFNLRMPSLLDQTNNRKLAEIVHSVNAILNKP